LRLTRLYKKYFMYALADVGCRLLMLGVEIAETFFTKEIVGPPVFKFVQILCYWGRVN